jgi:hypothetical protein
MQAFSSSLSSTNAPMINDISCSFERLRC